MSAEKMQFQTEVSELLNLVVHSLYSNKEIVLRELISNASDAIDKAKYELLTNAKLGEGDTSWRIKLIRDEAAGTLTFCDNGIGMDRDEAAKSLGTIAHSGTKEFVRKLSEQSANGDALNLIGQFGVGFYSAFMIADKVTVISRKRGDASENGVCWESDGTDSYTIDTVTKETPGTDVILTIKEDFKGFLSEYSVRRMVTTYSDYIEYPIVMDVEKPVFDDEGKATGDKELAEEVLNSQKAIWLMDKSAVTPEDYNQFYKHISHDFAEPAKVIHVKAEGVSEFYALLYIPQKAPFDLFQREMKFGPMLYVKRVQIMENCEELLPVWLRFVKGVVDSSDLPLNISREILQSNKHISLIQKNLVKRVLEALADLKKDDFDKYKEFYAEFGKVLKEGIYYDSERKESVAELCLFESTATKAGEFTTFNEYIAHMKPEQTEIYYITGKSRKEVEHSPYIEGLLAKGYEVLFMTDEVDDIIFTGMGQFKEKHLRSVLKGELNLDKEVSSEDSKTYEPLLAKMKEILTDSVTDVRLSTRLKGSPVVLVTEDGAPDAAMERMMKMMGQDVPKAKRTLELNPEHQLIKAINSLADKGKLADYAKLLYDQAVLLEGGAIEDPIAFVDKISELMIKGM